MCIEVFILYRLLSVELTEGARFVETRDYIANKMHIYADVVI